MDFSNFGTVSFTAQAKVAPFIDYLAQGKVMGTQCRQCGRKFFPPQVDCPNCLISDMDWFEIKEKGKLLTYTVVNYGPSGFEDETPYTLGIAQFPEGVSVLARMSKKIDTNDLRVGMEVKLVPINLPNEKITYEFEV